MTAPAPRADPAAPGHPRPRRAGAGGRRRAGGAGHAAWRRVELRYVDLKAGRHLQVTAYDDRRRTRRTTAPARSARRGGRRAARRALRQLARRHHHAVAPGARHQEGRGAAAHRRPRRGGRRPTATTTATRAGCCPEDDPVFVALGLSDHEGRMKPSRQAKYRQVEEFLRILDASVAEAIDKGHLRRPTEDEPLRIADLGCGNGYLTFAAHRFLTHVRGLPVVVTGVDVRQQSADHNAAVATGLGMAADFVVGAHRRRRRSTPRPRSCWRCTPATPPPTTRWPARSRGRRRSCWPRRAATTTSPPSCARTPDARAVRDADPPRHPPRALRRHPDRRGAGVAAADPGLSGRRHAVRREQAHPAQHPAARGAHRRPVSGGAVRQEYDDLVATWAIRPAARRAAPDGRHA